MSATDVKDVQKFYFSTEYDTPREAYTAFKETCCIFSNTRKR